MILFQPPPAAGEILTLWPVRISAALYVGAECAWILRKDAPARRAWTAACALYVMHVVAAFHFYHAWSQQSFYRETARRTAEVFGIGWGGGIYVSYLFTDLWIADAFWWWWRGLAKYRSRSGWIGVTIHLFFAFMFFNGTVVFGLGWVRWLGIVAAAALTVLWLTRGGHIRE
jgi:hypothetical protein